MPKQNLKASVLVVTMLILGIMLVTALSVSLVSIKDRKASMGANKSNQAFQNAQSGVELVMQQIKSGTNVKVGDIATKLGLVCNSGLLSGSASYTVELHNIDSANVACDDSVSTITSIKSVGMAGDDQRAIQAAVAANPSIKICAFWSVAADHWLTYVPFPSNGTNANCKALADVAYVPSSNTKLYSICCQDSEGMTSCGSQVDPYDTTAGLPSPNPCGWL